MVSAVSTKSCILATETTGHRLAEGVQVRPEQNGLLFYSRNNDPRLYFLSCGDVLSTDYFGSGCGLIDWLLKYDVVDQNVCKAFSGVLANLVAKGVLLAD